MYKAEKGKYMDKNIVHRNVWLGKAPVIQFSPAKP